MKKIIIIGLLVLLGLWLYHRYSKKQLVGRMKEDPAFASFTEDQLMGMSVSDLNKLIYTRPATPK